MDSRSHRRPTFSIRKHFEILVSWWQKFVGIEVSKERFFAIRSVYSAAGESGRVGRQEGGLASTERVAKVVVYTACLPLINNSIMFPWVPLFAFERGSITFPDCNAYKQMQVGSVYICTSPDRVFPLLTSYIMLGKQKNPSPLFLAVHQDEREIYISREAIYHVQQCAKSN